MAVCVPTFQPNGKFRRVRGPNCCAEGQLIGTNYCFVPAAAGILRQLPGMTFHQSLRIVAGVYLRCAEASAQHPTGGVRARRIHAGCPAAGGPCDFASVGLVSYSTNPTFHALQTTVSRRFTRGLTFSTSYWFSKTPDYVSSMNVAGSAPRLVSGENDIAQNPSDLRASMDLRSSTPNTAGRRAPLGSCHSARVSRVSREL